MKRLWKRGMFLVCLCMVLGVIAPVQAEGTDDSDTILWLDDMTAYGFTEDVNGFGGPDNQYLSESVILEYYDWLEPGNNIDIMGDGLSFGINGYPTYEGEKEQVLNEWLPYTTVYAWDTYNATREEPLTVKTMTINDVEFHYVSGQMITRKIYVGRDDYEGAVEVYFFHAYAVVGDWGFTFCGAAALELYGSEEELVIDFLSSVHFRDNEKQDSSSGIGGIADGFFADNEVKITSISPDSGILHTKFTTKIQLTFNYPIESYDFSRGTIYLCDAETNEVVCSLYDNKYINAQLCIRNKYLIWNVPTASGYFEKGHTYYLRMDEGFLDFSGTDETIGIDDPLFWRYSLVDDTALVTDSFYYYANGQHGVDTFTYSDSYFGTSSYTYQSDMATTSIAMAMAAYNYPDYRHGYLYVEDMMKKMGFTHLDHNDGYTQKPEENSIGVAFGSKKVGDVTVIAIAVRGGNYEDEWAGNFIVGDSSNVNHVGFAIGKNQVMDELVKYMNRNSVTGNVKFWLTGYSRGSAVANLAAAELTKGIDYPWINYSERDVYAYCFEVPANTTASDVGDSKYNNIFNIINPIDPVPRLALAEWGFSRYGRNVYIPARGVDSSYNTYIAEVKDRFNAMTDGEIEDLQFADQINILNSVMRMVYKVINNRDAYTRNYQEAFRLTLQDDSEFEEYQELDAWLKVISLLLDQILYYEYTDAEILDELEGLDWSLEDGSVMFDLGKMRGSKNYLSKAGNAIFFSHHIEWTYSWMKALDGTGVLEKTLEPNGLSGNSKYATLMVKFNCPVNVFAYDSAGNHLGTLNADGTVNVSEDSVLQAYIDATGAKVFLVPQWMDVMFDIQAVDDGTMTVNIQAVEVSTSKTVRYDCYEDLVLVKGEGYHMNLDSGALGSDYEAELYAPSGDQVTADYMLTGDNLLEYTIRTSCDENGYVTPGQTALTGSSVLLKAYPKEGYVLEGWYDSNGQCVGKDSALVVKASEDRSYEARFVKEQVFGLELLPIVGGVGAIALALAILLNAKKKKKMR